MINAKNFKSLCILCNQDKDNESFNVLNCTTCKVCSNCRITSGDFACGLCGRYYSDNELEILNVLKLSLS